MRLPSVCLGTESLKCDRKCTAKSSSVKNQEVGLEGYVLHRAAQSLVLEMLRWEEKHAHEKN